MEPKKLFMLLLYYLCPVLVYAQDTATHTPLRISGYGEVYYRYNFNRNLSDDKTSFTHSQNSFEPDMLSVKLEKAFGKVSFTADAGLGKRAEEFSYNDVHTSAAIKQLYITYAPAPSVKITAGTFATFIGYESVDPDQNANYSMSYLFSYGPFFHTGVKAEVTAGANTWMAGIFNPTDYKYAPPDSKKYIGAQWAWAPAGGSFSSRLSYIGGTDTAGVRNDQADLVLSTVPFSGLSVALDASYSRYGGSLPSSAWWGTALYLQGRLCGDLSLALRTEYFCDRDNLKVFTDLGKFPGGGGIWSFTLSADYKKDGLTLIPELRLDQASSALFTREGQNVRSTASVLMAAIYSF